MNASTQLRRIASLAYGEPLPAEMRNAGKTPVMSSGGVTGWHDAPNAPGPVIVVGRKGSHGSVWWSDVAPFVIDTAYAVLPHPERAHLRWLYYVLRSLRLSEVSSDVGVPGLSREKAYEQAVPLVRRDQQRRIADFLDDRVARIDRIVAAREWQDHLNVEAFCSAVTGMAAPVSGDHGWRLHKFMRVARVSDGLVDPRDPRWSELPLIAPNHIEKGTGRLLLLESAVAQGAESGKGRVLAGQVVYSKIRPALRKAVVAPVDALCSADCYPLALVGPVVEPGFLLAAVLSDPFTQQVVEVADRVAMPKVNRESLGETRIWVPTEERQRFVAGALAERRKELEGTSAALRRSLDLMREYKQSLITAAVTGEFDVTTASTTIPGEDA